MDIQSPLVFGPDGKPKIREFGNLKSSRRFGRPEISGEIAFGGCYYN
jgi:hypothetical protein